MKKILSFAMLPLILGGCSHIGYPTAEIFPYTTQKKVQSAHHWKVLAEHEAELISKKLPAGSLIKISCDDSTCKGNVNPHTGFKTIYKELLTSSLVQRGLHVDNSSRPRNFSLSYNFQILRHSGRDNISRFRIFLAHEENAHAADVTVEPIYGYFDKITSESETEIVITTKVIDSSSNLTVFADSNVYYFNPQDIGHYVEPMPEPTLKTMKVIGK